MKIMSQDSVNIKKLDESEKVRKNIGMYIGKSDGSGTHHLLDENISNSIDEYLAGYCDKIEITINDDGSLTIEDNGRGIPIYDENGNFIIDQIFKFVHMGGKFDRKGYEFSGGKHGVGTTVINYLSDYMKIDVYREGYHFSLKFKDGILVEKPNKQEKTKKTGTRITFKPSLKYLSDVKWDVNKILDRLKKHHYLAKGLRFIFNYKDSEGVLIKKEFYNEKGLEGFIEDITKDESIKGVANIVTMENEIIKYVNPKTGEEDLMKISFSFQYINQRKQNIYGYTNNIYQGEGGSHVDAIKDLIYKALKSNFEKLNKKLDKSINKDDFLDGLVGIVSLNLSNPTLEGQTKNKLGDQFIIKIITNALLEKLEIKLLADSKGLEKLYEHVKKNNDTRKSIEKIELLDKKQTKNTRISSLSKLTDAESKKREECELFIIEGESAGGLIQESRNPQIQGIFKLKGKPINIITKGLKRTLGNEESINLIQALGTGIGKNFDIKKLRYGKIFILSDADPDGGHIQTLLLGMLKVLMPGLFKKGVIYRIIPPLHGITFNKGGKKLYLKDNKELKKIKEKYKNDSFIHTRFKGLGEMNSDALYDTCINPKNRISEKITDDSVKENLEFIENILGSEGAFKYDFLTNYVETKKDEIKKNSSNEILGVASETMYDYGIYANQDRAIPNIEDGLKPVHRRILYATDKMGINSSGKAVKSSQIVGKVMGSLHPHGDSSIYGAAAKLTQEFYIQNPLMGKSGNCGSLFGLNNYASMRYTEMQLSSFSEKVLLKNLNDKKQIVPFVDNYDGTILEPEVLPSIIPNILLMPTFGIGVGLSCQMPPHNINEVIDACIGFLTKKKFKVYDYIKGPDFPLIDNEIVSGEDELEKIYNEDAKGLKTLGNIKYRVKLHYNKKENLIEIRSLPYNVEFSTIYEKLIELSIGEEKKVDKKNKKIKYISLPFNKSLKTEVKKVVNNSGNSGSGENPIKIKIYLNKGADVDIVKGKLYKLSSLQTSVSIRAILINRKKRIKGYSFYDIINEFISFRKETIIKYFNIKKNDVLKKIKGAELKMIYIDYADFIYKTVREENDDEKIGLIFSKKMNITIEEGKAFIDYSLRSMRNLEKIKILKNIELYNKELKEYEDILNNEKLLIKYMIKEFKSIKKDLGVERVTQIIGKQKDFNIDSNIGAIYEDKVVRILYSYDSGFLYKVSGKDIKIENRTKDFIEKYKDVKYFDISNRKKIYLIQGNKGFNIKIGDIPEEDPQHIGLLNKKIKIGEKIHLFYSEDEKEKEIIIILENNNLLRIKLEDLMKNNQGFKIGNKKILQIKEINSIDSILIRVNDEKYIFKYNIDEIPLVKNVGNGVKVAGKTIFINSYGQDEKIIELNINGKQIRKNISNLKISKRTNKKSSIQL